MSKKQKIHGWTVADVAGADPPALRLTKGAHALLLEHEPGMARDVVLEYATTRILEAEHVAADAAGRADAKAKLDQHVAWSRARQKSREAQRHAAALAPEE